MRANSEKGGSVVELVLFLPLLAFLLATLFRFFAESHTGHRRLLGENLDQMRRRRATELRLPVEQRPCAVRRSFCGAVR